MSRYAMGEPGEEFEAGSGGRVLRNQLGITDPIEADLIEASLLTLAQARSYGRIEPTTPIDVRLVRELHRSWLERLYGFAGEIRTVDISKDYVRFAPVAYMESTLKALDATMIVETPCDGMDEARLIVAVARVHIELVLAHPFREGNGRLARWIADLMALQAGAPPLDWRFEERTEIRREAYFAALRRGFAGDVSPLESLVRKALARARRSAEDPFDRS